MHLYLDDGTLRNVQPDLDSPFDDWQDLDGNAAAAFARTLYWGRFRLGPCYAARALLGTCWGCGNCAKLCPSVCTYERVEWDTSRGWRGTGKKKFKAETQSLGKEKIQIVYGELSGPVTRGRV